MGKCLFISRLFATCEKIDLYIALFFYGINPHVVLVSEFLQCQKGQGTALTHNNDETIFYDSNACKYRLNLAC